MSNWTIGHAQFFDEFELYWLGRQYEGLPLNYMGRGTDADDVTHVALQAAVAIAATARSARDPNEVRCSVVNIARPFIGTR